jgi:adenylate kinase
MKLIILGIQGSGKGTESKIVAEHYKIKHISTGDLLREEQDKFTELGKEIKSFIDKGNFVPDELITKMLKSRLPKDNWILDGYPRNLQQAKTLDKITSITAAIYLEIPEQEVYDRLALRLQCKKCGKIYGKNIPAPDSGICQCGNKLERRQDDLEIALIKKRIKTFKEETLPILEHYKNKLITINGNQKVMPVFNDIRDALDNL